MFLWFPIHVLCVRSVLSCSLQTTKKKKTCRKHISHKHVYRNKVLVHLLCYPHTARTQQKPQQPATIAWMQNPSLKAPINLYGLATSSIFECMGHILTPVTPFSCPVTIFMIKWQKGFGDIAYHIRYQTFRLWTCRSISHANNWLSCPFHVSFVRCHFTCIVFPSCFAFIPFIVPFTFCLSVCVFPCNSL